MGQVDFTTKQRSVGEREHTVEPKIFNSSFKKKLQNELEELDGGKKVRRTEVPFQV